MYVEFFLTSYDYVESVFRLIISAAAANTVHFFEANSSNCNFLGFPTR